MFFSLVTALLVEEATEMILLQIVHCVVVGEQIPNWVAVLDLQFFRA